MNTYLNSFMMAGALLLTACHTQDKTDTGVIGKRNITVENGIMTPEILMSFGRISEPSFHRINKKYFTASLMLASKKTKAIATCSS